MCHCITQINENLKDKNTRLVLPIFLVARPMQVFIETEKINKKVRQGPIRLFGAYCPFCGEPYDKQPENPVQTLVP